MAWWVPLIAAGAQLAGSLISSNKSDKNAGATATHLGGLDKVGKQYYEPFITSGKHAQSQATAAYQRMLDNPTSFVEQIMAGYKPSKGYDFRRKNALDVARNSAAAGGFSGTYNDQLQQAGLADNLLAQDLQQYFQNVLGVHNTGLAGQQHIGDTGFQAAGSLADYIGNAIGSQTNLSHAQNAQKNSNMGGILGGLGGLTGAALPAISSMFGGGGTGGGAAGMAPALGAGLAGAFGGGGLGNAFGGSGSGGSGWVPSARYANAARTVNGGGYRGFSGGYGGIK